MTEHGKAHDPEKLSSQKSKIAKDSSCLRENNREDMSGSVWFS